MSSLFSSISRGFQKVTEDASKLNDKFNRSAVEAFDPGWTIAQFMIFYPSFITLRESVWNIMGKSRNDTVLQKLRRKISAIKYYQTSLQKVRQWYRFNKFKCLFLFLFSCAGIFCDKCCPLTSIGENSKFNLSLIPNYDEESDLSSIRICDACSRGECPGMPIKEEVRAQLESSNDKDDGNVSIRTLVNKVSGTLGEQSI